MNSMQYFSFFAIDMGSWTQDETVELPRQILTLAEGGTKVKARLKE